MNCRKMKMKVSCDAKVNGRVLCRPYIFNFFVEMVSFSGLNYFIRVKADGVTDGRAQQRLATS